MMNSFVDLKNFIEVHRCYIQERVWASRPDGMRVEQERDDRHGGDLQRLIWNRIQVLEVRAEETFEGE